MSLKDRRRGPKSLIRFSWIHQLSGLSRKAQGFPRNSCGQVTQLR